jgi:hypothetical protein
MKKQLDWIESIHSQDHHTQQDTKDGPCKGNMRKSLVCSTVYKAIENGCVFRTKFVREQLEKDSSQKSASSNTAKKLL